MYKVGDKVETPLGIGVIQSLEETIFVDEKGSPIYDYAVKFENDYDYYTEHKLDKIIFLNHVVKPYHTAHEKLIEMGYEEKIHDTVVKHDVESGRYKQYAKNYEVILIDIEDREFTTYTLYNGSKGVDGVSWVNHELSLILTQYLEELK